MYCAAKTGNAPSMFRPLYDLKTERSFEYLSVSSVMEEQHEMSNDEGTKLEQKKEEIIVSTRLKDSVLQILFSILHISPQCAVPMLPFQSTQRFRIGFGID